MLLGAAAAGVARARRRRPAPPPLRRPSTAAPAPGNLDRVRNARNIAIIALIALVVATAPGGGAALNEALTILGIVFFAVLGLFGYRLYREHRMTLDGLPDLDRLVLYSAIGVAVLTFAAWGRLRAAGAGGILGGIALFVLCSLAGYWVYTRARRYG